MDDPEKKCCETCYFYGLSDVGERICNDFDGLYFQWIMLPDEKCPDYIKKEPDLVGVEC